MVQIHMPCDGTLSVVKAGEEETPLFAWLLPTMGHLPWLGH